MNHIQKNFGGLFGGLFRVMPGAGIAKTLQDVKRLCTNTDISVITLGSITIEPRLGNPGNTFYHDPDWGYTINSVGMTNPGKYEYAKILHNIIQLVHTAEKKLVVSVAAIKDYTEYTELFEMCQACGVDAVELNFGCPNVWDAGTSHAPISFDPTQIKRVLAHIKSNVSVRIPVWIKISPIILTPTAIRETQTGGISQPYFVKHFTIDRKLLRDIVFAIQPFHFVKAIVSTNTVGQVRILDENHKPVIGPNPQNPSGTGGLAGRSIHDISVEQTQLLREWLPSHIDVIGAGGIENGQSMKDFIDAGAIAVQVVSKYWTTNDPGIFSQIATEFFELMT